MTTTLDPVPPGPAAAPPSPPSPPPPRGRRKTRVGFVAAGAVIALLALALVAGGVLALWAADQEDADGFFSTDAHMLTTGSPALVSENLDLGGADALFDSGDLGKLRISAKSTPGEPLFVGIAPTSAVEHYLDGVSRTTVTDLEWGPFDGAPRHHDTPGTGHVAPPRSTSMWVASAQGSGKQTVTWDMRDGDWSVVVMNADGSPHVDAELTAAARIDWLDDLGWVTLGAGGLLAAVAGALLVAGLRGRRS